MATKGASIARSCLYDYLHHAPGVKACVAQALTQNWVVLLGFSVLAYLLLAAPYASGLRGRKEARRRKSCDCFRKSEANVTRQAACWMARREAPGTVSRILVCPRVFRGVLGACLYESREVMVRLRGGGVSPKSPTT